MATDLPTTNGASTNGGESSNQQSVKEGLARMLKGGVIMDVVNAEQVTVSFFFLLRSISSSANGR
jgi:pyridoxal 5'-phosphate synthase pdxS subunit